MKKIVLLCVAVLFLGCSDKVDNKTTSAKLYKGNPDKYVDVDIKVLTAERAKLFKPMFYYTPYNDSTIFENYNPPDIPDYLFEVTVDNKIGGNLTKAFDMTMVLDYNGVEREIWDYDVAASSKDFETSYADFPILNNDDKITFIAKSNFIWWVSVFPELEKYSGIELDEKLSQLLPDVGKNGKYSLVFKVIVGPGILGLTDEILSKRWDVIVDQEKREIRIEL